MDDPNRPMNEVESMIASLRESMEARRNPVPASGFRPGTIVKCPNFRRGRRYVVAPDGSLRRVLEK